MATGQLNPRCSTVADMYDLSLIKTGEDFELLCEDLLKALGFESEKESARGPDGGSDLIVSRGFTDEMGFAERHRYLVECKHFAKSKKSVREADIGNYVARMSRHGCTRYLLVTSSVPSETVRAQLAAIATTNPAYRALIWSKADLARLLQKHPAIWQTHVQDPIVRWAGKKALPGVRAGITWDSHVGGHHLVLRTGEYEHGAVGELSLTMHKEGAAFRSLLDCFAAAVSLGLQHGISLDVFVDHFTFTRFEPQGPVEGHPYIKFATSTVDYVFRVLGVHYLKRHELAHVRPPSTKDALGPSKMTRLRSSTRRKLVKSTTPKRAIAKRSAKRASENVAVE